MSSPWLLSVLVTKGRDTPGPLGPSLRVKVGTHCGRLWFSVHTEVEIVGSREFIKEGRLIFLLWARGLGMAIFALIL